MRPRLLFLLCHVDMMSLIPSGDFFCLHMFILAKNTGLLLLFRYIYGGLMMADPINTGCDKCINICDYISTQPALVNFCKILEGFHCGRLFHLMLFDVLIYFFITSGNL